MKRAAAKFGFVHRTLWQREHRYRWAVLLGPPPLIGCAVAALVLAGIQRHQAPPGAFGQAPWAQWTRPVIQDGQPFGETPRAPLPPRDASGRYAGLQPGWVGGVQSFTVDATMDVRLVAPAGSFTLDQPAIPLSRILDAGPATGLFAGTGTALFAVPSGGSYAFSARLTRAGTQSATCMVWLGSAHHRILRNEVLDVAADGVLNFPPVQFRLQPGLFIIQFATGCWRGSQMDGAGELILMVRRPGEAALTPATAAEVLRPMKRRQTGAAPAPAAP